MIIKQRPVVVYNAEKFSLQYGIRANSAIASAMNTEFSLEIANKIKRANTPQSSRACQFLDGVSAIGRLEFLYKPVQ